MALSFGYKSVIFVIIGLGSLVASTEAWWDAVPGFCSTSETFLDRTDRFEAFAYSASSSASSDELSFLL